LALGAEALAAAAAMNNQLIPTVSVELIEIFGPDEWARFLRDDHRLKTSIH